MRYAAKPSSAVRSGRSILNIGYETLRKRSGAPLHHDGFYSILFRIAGLPCKLVRLSLNVDYSRKGGPGAA